MCFTEGFSVVLFFGCGRSIHGPPDRQEAGSVGRVTDDIAADLAPRASFALRNVGVITLSMRYCLAVGIES